MTARRRQSRASDRVGVVVMLDSLQRPGGGERLAVEGAIRLDPERFDRTFCLTRWEPRFETEPPASEIVARLREAGVRVVGLRRRHRFDLAAWRPLLRLLRSEGTDVLHAHLFGSNLWAALLGPAAGVPVVVAHEHMWAYAGGGIRPLLDREVVARRSSAFIAVSEEGRRRMIELERIPAEDIVLLPNGIAAPAAGDGARLRAELAIPERAPLVGSVGHLRSEKAFEVLIEAAGLLRDARPDLHLLIAGEGPERERLERLRDELGLGGRVHLPGGRSDIPDVLAALDVAVCCSDFEGGPLSVMEYMAAALPIVGTDVGGLPELLDHGRAGVLVPPRDPGELAAAIAALLDDPDRARALGGAATELRRREYDVDVWIGRLQDLYLRLLDEASPGRRPGG